LAQVSKRDCSLGGWKLVAGDDQVPVPIGETGDKLDSLDVPLPQVGESSKQYGSRFSIGGEDHI
jgi:hypothetical protein